MTPILKIPIDDAAVQRYFAAFKKYQEEAQNQSEVWKESNETLGLMAGTMAGVAAEIAFQAEETRKLTAEEKKREEAQKKAAKEKADADKAEADREKAAAARRRHAIDQVKEYSRSLADAAVNLGKWALIGEGAGLALGALSFWGLDKFVSGVGEERRLSQGIGVSMGQRQGMSLNMQRYFDVNSVLETVANAQATPADWGVFRMMGVDPKGKDPSQLTGELALAARRMFLADRGNLGLAQAQGLTRIFSPDDLRRLAAIPEEKDLQSSINDSNKFAASAGLRDEVGRKWQQFLINLDTAGLKIKNTLIDKLTVLENNGSLDKLIQKFGDLAVGALDKIDFQKLGDGVDAFTKYITSTKFQTDIKTFADDIELIAKKVGDALVFLGVIPSSTVAQSDVGSIGGSVSSKDRLNYGLHIGGGALGGATIGGVIGGPVGALAGGALGGLGGFLFSKAPGESYERSVIASKALDYRLPKGMLESVYGLESGYGKHSGLSSKGALGPFQFMPDVAKQYGISDRTDFVQEAMGAAHLLSDELKRYQGDVQKALAAYNWGSGNLDKDIARHGSQWLQYAPKETRDYVKRGQMLITLNNQTGASVATTVNSAAGG